MLEANLHVDNTFATLTYEDDPHSLEPKHLQDFLKRLRSSVSPLKLRYFAVGEYGDQSGRPHYHAALFGYPNCVHGKSRYNRVITNCCDPCDRIRDTWDRGYTFLGSLTVESSQYIAGYVTKKMTDNRDPRLGSNLHPEFARMSLKPGIGADFVPEIASTLMQHDLDSSQGDVPVTLRHGSRQLPLGRYLRRKTREHIGKPANAPQTAMDSAQEEVRSVYEATKAAHQSALDSGEKPLPGTFDQKFKAALIQAGSGKRAGSIARSRIFKKRGTI